MDHHLPPHRLRRRARGPILLLAILALCATLAGCGGSGASDARATSSPTSSRVTSTTTVIGQTTTTTTTTSPLPGTGRPTVMIGDKNYAEQFVLGQLYLQALRAQGFKVNITENIGPTSVVLASLKNHTLAMYPEYLNVFDEIFAHVRHPPKSIGAADSAGEEWAVRHGLQLLAPTPFSDTTGVAVTDAYAAENHLRSIGDLLNVANTLVMGGAVQFKTSRSGIHALESGYGVAPASFTPLAVGDEYSALNNDTVQAAFINTTDGQLATGDYRVLHDPQNVFGYGNVVPVITQKAMTEEGPAFAATIDRVDRTLTLSTMRQLNNLVSIANLPPAAVALQYLQTHGLLGPLSPSDY
ncbi:MAG TPA: glycine betaine ABC transporter substrate-binding protein [Solirubrobacteraceae bacterium]|nr:glycine betaine ABC transporter substrate-binding protein [Solirubrobacteraceae bacterium]